MKYLSVGTDQLFAELYQPIKNGNPKPTGGLWATEYDPKYPNYNVWVEFLSIQPHILFYKRTNGNPFLTPASLLTLNDDTKIFKLENQYQLDFLKKYYPSADNWIDFEKLSQDYDCLYIDIMLLYRDITPEEKSKIAEFNVSTLLIFNLDCIKHYQKAEVDIEPFDYEYEHEFSRYCINVDSQLHAISKSDDQITELINRIKKEESKTLPNIEQLLQEKYGEILTNFIAEFKLKNASTEHPETLKQLLIRHISRSI